MFVTFLGKKEKSLLGNKEGKQMIYFEILGRETIIKINRVM